jgi:hypothetical protein
MRCIIWVLVLAGMCPGCAGAQVLSHRPASQPASSLPQPAPPVIRSTSMSLTVPVGTPLKVTLDQEVRIQKVGQPVRGKMAEPVYVFDTLVVPAGSEVLGRVAEIKSISKKERTLAGMNADFSPPHQVRLEFNELVLANGRHVPLQTVVSPGSGGVLQFVPANANRQSKTNAAKNAASRKISAARQEVKRQWDTARQQIHEPGKMHRLKRLAVAQLPYRPQYIDSGAGFNADLQRPLDFGVELLRPDELADIGNQPPPGSVVHALLTTPLNSKTSKKGDPVEAVISQPLLVSNHLFLPQGSRLKGSVLEVRPARRLGRNGQLRIVFHQVVPASGVAEQAEQKVEASLEGVEVARGQHLSLDSEGGAQVTTPKTRYLATGIAVMLAASSVSPEHEHDADAVLGGGRGGGDVAGGAANGASGFRFLGTIVGALAHSRAVTSGLGFYGAGMSVYSHFLARGRDVVYPKDMEMVVGLGTRDSRTSSAAEPALPPVPGRIGPL